MYEEYMQNLLGYPMRSYPNTYEEQNLNSYNYNMSNTYAENLARQEWQNMASSEELEDCYPEIYNIVYPMVKKACMRNTRPLTREVIDSMVDDIYSNLETNNRIELNINLNNEVRSTRPECANTDSNVGSNKKDVENRNQGQENTIRENRQNSAINDLIRILLIRELLGRPGFGRPPMRPPFRPNRPIPPMQRPPMPRYDEIGSINYYLD